jgi:SAM-dependent MidA family methyltransferase
LTRPSLTPMPDGYFAPFLESELDLERSEALRQHLVRRIRAAGPMTFVDFMHESLYGSLGFYSFRKGGIGQGTPFLAETTSPEQDSVFAQSIGRRIGEAWQEMGKPERFEIVEMGAGTGALARDILDTLKRSAPELYEGIRYTIVDLSPSLEEVQRSTVTDGHMRWIYGTALDLPLRDIQGVILSNELVDSLPFHRVMVDKGRLKEIYTAEEDGRLVDRLDRPSDEFRDYFKTVGIKPEEGVEIHICLELTKWMTGVARALKRGYVITIDYGDYANLVHLKDGPWHEAVVAGTNYTLTSGGDKAIYERVGGVDITTYVDFSMLMKAGERLGLKGMLVSQNDFLARAGAANAVAAKLSIGDIRTSRNLDQISRLFNDRHKVLIQAKG